MSSTRSELLGLDRPPYATPPEEADPLVRQLLNKNVTVRGIYSPDSMARSGAVDLAYAAAQAGEESRIHPSVPIKLIIADRSVALLPIAMETSRGSALVVRENALVEALCQLFFLLWEQAVPVIADSGQEEVSAVNERLLTMLAAGMKDEAIGRNLGISTRTVGRRVAELMEHLNARTRFEAGVYAERRDLLGGKNS